MRTTLFSLLTISSILMASFTPSPHLVVTSTGFIDHSVIPTKYSCEGNEVSPPLHLANIPTTAKTLALIMHDPDAPMAGGFTHWVVWNIDVRNDIPENYKLADQGLNSAHKNGYKGMCPPSGTHHYYFKAYALDTKLNLSKETDKAGLEKAMTGHILAEGELMGLYKKTQ
jgi:Raf kinase inhibitor-like YbhB/YbcL family protein